MINEDFCSTLEYKITGALADMKQEELKGFWCDGVLSPATEHSKDSKLMITLTAFIGKTGQDRYTLTLHLGPKGRQQYIQQLDLASCIPDTPGDCWIRIDTAKRTMSIQLD